MSPTAPGTSLASAAAVLLIFTCITPPTWENVYFLVANNGQRIVRYGCFGFSNYGPTIGYDLDQAGFHEIGTPTLNKLTSALILHPIAAGLAGLSFVFGLSNTAVSTGFMTISSALATIVTLIIFIIDMVLWGTARQHFRDQGISSNYGNANWLTLGALIALLMGFCASSCGLFTGHYRRTNIPRRNNATS